MKMETLLARAGAERDTATGAISYPIHVSATFAHPAFGQTTGFDYSRSSNPTRQLLEETLAAAEGGSKACAFGSGMAALTATLMLFKPGDRLVVSEDLYGGTYRLFDKIFSHYGVKADYADTTSIGGIEAAIRPETKALLIETPTNPCMNITDLRAAASLASQRGLLTIVDNTFLTFYCQRPLDLGADLVVYSGSKYLSGHNDVIAGGLVAKTPELGERIAFIQNATGGILSPFDSWLWLRGMKTLPLRMERAAESAMKIATFLSRHPAVDSVCYPGLTAHLGYAVNARQSKSPGAMISFRLKSPEAAVRVIERMQLISFAESLGGVESLITYPVRQTHQDIPAEIRQRTGVTDTLLRLSVGIEDAGDLIEDLEQALA